MTDATLVLNAGSSSLKFSAFLDGDPPQALLRGQLEGILTKPRFVAKDAAGKVLGEHEWAGGTSLGHAGAIDYLFTWGRGGALGGHKIAAVGHRVGHGGARFGGPVVVTAEVMAALTELIPLAPLHQPHNLAAIEAVTRQAPQMPQVACFDTAFHRTQPTVAQALAIPRRYAAEGVHRYGFHGLSYEYVASVLPGIDARAAAGRTVVAHLGNGASMCALLGGRSVATTMGFSAADGLPMGTRCGALDPGVLLYLMDRHGMDVSALGKLIYQQSGLLGVSGISSDMRVLLASTDPRAAEAVELFVYRIGRELGSLAAALGGLDALVFTGGIGENAAPIRARVCLGAAWLGMRLDEAANAAGVPRISRTNSQVAAWVVPTNEELMIARHTRRLLQEQRPKMEEPTVAKFPSPPLLGQKALVVGIANEYSIAYGCGAFRQVGAEAAITYLNEKARPYVEPLAKELGAPVFLPLNVQEPGQMEALFERIGQTWGRLDIALHSIAFAPKDDLQGGLLQCSAAGFGVAMDVSCHSFVRMARLAAPLMPDGGTLFAMTYYGAQKVVPNYSVMGPVKAALEASVRYLAHELGPRGIRVHALSPGPIKTRAAGGLKDFDLLLNEAAGRAPVGELVDIDDVGMTAAYLATPYARRVTGGTVYVDAGLNIMA